MTRAEPSAASLRSTSGATLRASPVDPEVRWLAEIVAKGGPDEVDDERLHTILRALHRQKQSGRGDSDVLRLRGALGEGLSPQTMQGASLAKRHGYAGDFEIIDWIYTRRVRHVGSALHLEGGRR
jgi:hypothetical protein